MKKSTRKATTKFDQTPINPIDRILKDLDVVACEMETKYGAGILPNLCAPETSAKFLRVKDALDEAIQSGDYDTVKQKVESLKRGWLKMEQEAKDSGNLEQIEAWYVFDNGGIEYIVCKHEGDAARMAALHPSKANVIYSLADVARMIQQGSVVNFTKREVDTFKAEIARPSIGQIIDDEIPYF